MSSRPSRVALDVLDSMASGGEWTPHDLRMEIGAASGLSHHMKRYEAKGWVAESHRVQCVACDALALANCGHSNNRIWYTITEAGRDVLAQEIAAGRVPGVS